MATGHPFTTLLGRGMWPLPSTAGQILSKHRALWICAVKGLAASLQHYFDMSDQVNLRLLSAARQVDGAWVAGALALQRLPLMGGEGAADSTAAGRIVGERKGSQLGDEEAAENQWQEALALLGTVSQELTDPSLSSEDLLYRLFHEQGVQVAEADALCTPLQCRALHRRAKNLGPGRPERNFPRWRSGQYL